MMQCCLNEKVMSLRVQYAITETRLIVTYSGLDHFGLGAVFS